MSLTSCLNAKVDLALRRMSDGVATKIHIHTDGKKGNWKHDLRLL